MEKNENERKQDGKGREQDKIKIIVSFPSDLTRDRKFKKKQQKKFENLKNTIMASFQAKLGTKGLRKIENKNYRSVPFLPIA